MGNFTIGETVWTKRGTLTSFGVSVRSAEDWVQVELRKKGGTTGQQKGVWLVAYGEEEVEMKKQQLKDVPKRCRRDGRVHRRNYDRMDVEG